MAAAIKRCEESLSRSPAPSQSRLRGLKVEGANMPLALGLATDTAGSQGGLEAQAEARTEARRSGDCYGILRAALRLDERLSARDLRDLAEVRTMDR